MTKKFEQAEKRIDEMGFTDEQKEFIFADWDEGEEHLDWLLDAPKSEIESWGQAVEWGRESGF